MPKVWTTEPGARKYQKRIADYAPADHGRNRVLYTDKGCRCDDCRAGNAARRRQDRAKTGGRRALSEYAQCQRCGRERMVRPGRRTSGMCRTCLVVLGEWPGFQPGGEAAA